MVSEPHVTPESFRPNGMKVIQVWSQREKKRMEESAKVLRWAGLDRKGQEGDILRTYTQLDFKTHTFALESDTRFIQGTRKGSCLSVCVRVEGFCPWGFGLLTRLVLEQCLFVTFCAFVSHHTSHWDWSQSVTEENNAGLLEMKIKSLKSDQFFWCPSLCGVLRDSSQALCKIKFSSKNIKYSLVPKVKVHHSWGSLGHVGELIHHHGHTEMYWNASASAEVEGGGGTRVARGAGFD